ncbi:cytochrome c oxidase subunit 3, partial [Mycobacterium tuberculosis]
CSWMDYQFGWQPIDSFTSYSFRIYRETLSRFRAPLHLAHGQHLATGFHGLHVTGGLIAFIFLLVRTGMSKFTPAQATASIVVSYYWHFVDIVWIALFTVIYFIR